MGATAGVEHVAAMAALAHALIRWRHEAGAKEIAMTFAAADGDMTIKARAGEVEYASADAAIVVPWPWSPEDEAGPGDLSGDELAAALRG